MSKPVMTADKNMTVKEAVDIMDKHDFGSMPITENGWPIGIVTERDLLRRLLAKELTTNSKLKKIMTEDVVTINHDSDIVEASRLMSENNFRRLLVVKDKKVVGIATAKDVMEVLSDKNGKR